jgi:branched-chain amino acid transport system substrate-binding protein
MDLALGEVNASGGIKGTPLTILYRDSGSSPERAERAAVELYDRFDVPLILGAVLSSETLRVAPLAEQRRKILLSPASSSPEITRAGRYVFRVYPSDTLEGAYMAQLAGDELGLRSVRILAIDNAFGRGLSAVFRRSFSAGEEPVIQLYSAHGEDHAAVAARAVEAPADGIYLVGYYSDMARILKEIRKLAPGARVLSTSSFGNPKTLEEAGDAAEGVVFPATVFDPGSDDPAVMRFVARYRESHHADPDLWAAHGYDAVLVAAEAIRRAGGAVPERLAEALRGIRDFRGASGTLSFDAEGDVVQYPRAYIVHQGRFILYRDYRERMKSQPPPAGDGKP